MACGVGILKAAGFAVRHAYFARQCSYRIRCSDFQQGQLIYCLISERSLLVLDGHRG